MLDKNKICQDLRDNGFSIISNFASEDQLKKLNSEFDLFLEKEHKGTAHFPYSEGQSSRVNKGLYDTKLFPCTTEVFYTDDLNDIAKEYLQEDFDLSSEIFIVKDVVGSRHIANDLHYDVLNTLKFFLYLTDTKTANGAFVCVPGSHLYTKKYREFYKDKICYENRHLTRELDAEKSKEKIPIEGKAGTLIIFDTDVWHKAGKVSIGERRVMRGHTRPIKNFKKVQSRSKQNNLYSRILRKIK